MRCCCMFSRRANDGGECREEQAGGENAGPCLPRQPAPALQILAAQSMAPWDLSDAQPRPVGLSRQCYGLKLV